MPNDTTAAVGGFCANTTFIDSLFNATATTTNACISHLTGYGEPMLNQIFTYVSAHSSRLLRTVTDPVAVSQACENHLLISLRSPDDPNPSARL